MDENENFSFPEIDLLDSPLISSIFTESGNKRRAILALINAKEWDRAMDLAKTESTREAAIFFKKVADGYKLDRLFEV